MKKTIKYFLITIAVLAAAFFSIGLFSPSISYQSKVIINKPVETSFSIFINPFKLSEWIPGLKGIGWISGMQNTEGSKWKFIIAIKGDKHEMVQTLTEFRQNELYAFETDNKMFSNRTRVKFSGNGNTSDIVATSTLEGKNVFWKSIFFFMKSAVAEQDQEMYENLKKVIEQEN